jgi:ribosomal-protein-alanine N-acetyltransferase
MDVEPIRTPRLELLSMPPPFIEALLEDRYEEAAQLLGIALPHGPPDRQVKRFLVRRLEQIRRDPAVQRWLARVIVLRTRDRSMIGNVGFHGEPGVNAKNREDALEIGYGILPEYRGRGYATEAVRALIEWARGEGFHHFIASVAPDNSPSLAIVQKLGFVRTGERWDEEDGIEDVFELGD